MSTTSRPAALSTSSRASFASFASFARFAWVVLAFNLGVIAWGAFVRATGSGAGCGEHWPLCNGEVVPRSPGLAMLIELTHRVTSGITLILVAALAVWAWRAFPPGDRVRKGAAASLVLVLMEAAIGAGIVLLGKVAHDASLTRAPASALHLVNTFFLLGALTLTAWWASGGPPVRVRSHSGMAWAFAATFLLMVMTGASGAVAALGDTLFPATSLAEGMRQDLSTGAHLFLRLRAVHPLFALLAAAAALATATIVSTLRPSPSVKRAALRVRIGVLVQVGAGLLNLVLLAPVPMQLVHLLLADAVWISLVLLAASSLAEEETPAPSAILAPAAE